MNLNHIITTKPKPCLLNAKISSLAVYPRKIKTKKKTTLIKCLSDRHREIIEERCIKDVIQNLTDRLTHRNIEHQMLLGLAGPPGSGKSTISSELSKQLNLIKNDDLYSIVVPMDGFHYYKHELDAMEDPILAHARRGAHWTFNSTKFLKSLESLKESKEGSFPSFNHGYGDPVENNIKVTKSNVIVIVEGNYLFLDIDLWKDIKKLFDEKWYVSCPVEICKERVYKRHVATGKDEKTALRRVDENDGPNAVLVENYMDDVDLIINGNVPLK